MLNPRVCSVRRRAGGFQAEGGSIKPFTTAAVVVCLLVAALDLVRSARGWMVIVGESVGALGGMSIPLWVSYTGAVLPAVLAVMLWLESREDPRPAGEGPSLRSSMWWRPALINHFRFRTVALVVALGAIGTGADAFPVSKAAWSDAQWEQHCRNVRTSYNPSGPLDIKTLTVKPDDPRFLDFLYWVWANKIIEHQVEQIGGTEWKGPTHGVIFHWAPGSRWETHTVVPFEHAIHHIADEHNWRDLMFKDFFEPFGPVAGVNIKERLSFDKPPTWAQFLKHIGGPRSPYYRYVFHQESTIDPVRRIVTLVGGQGVAFEYSFERYLVEIKEVVTDCKAYQFFELYDRYGAGFASKPGWAGQPLHKP